VCSVDGACDWFLGTSAQQRDYNEEDHVTTHPRFEITLEALPTDDGAPPVVRLRRFLKAALRSFGLRCVECRQVDAAEDAASGPPVGRRERAVRPSPLPVPPQRRGSQRAG
jgi:hypothetical protein